MHEYRKRIRAAAVEWRNEHLIENRQWTLETVKHLAFINAAGLAGAAAIYASSENAKKIQGLLGLPVAVYFALGLSVAVFDMWLNSKGALNRVEEIDRRLKIWDKCENPEQKEAEDLLRSLGKGRYFMAAEVFGWVSAFLFVLGAYPFISLSF